MPSPGASSWDRQRRQASLPLAPQYRGTDYTKDMEAFSWHPFQFAGRQAVSACSGSPPQCSIYGLIHSQIFCTRPSGLLSTRLAKVLVLDTKVLLIWSNGQVFMHVQLLLMVIHSNILLTEDRNLWLPQKHDRKLKKFLGEHAPEIPLQCFSLYSM